MRKPRRGAVILLIVCLFFLPSCEAIDNDFSIWDKLFNPVWDGDFSSLNYKATYPENNVTSGGNMEAWLDIVGWFNMSRINGTDYIYGDPANQSITEYNAIDTLGWNDNMDWIKHELLYDVVNDTLIVQDNITMLWHHSEEKTTSEGHTYIQKTYYYSYLTVYDSEIIPKQYVYDGQNIEALITFYNNSINPKSVIFIPDKLGLYSIDYTYKNESVHEDLMTGYVENNSKGIEFVNFTYNSGWSDPGGNLSHIGVCAVVKGGNFTPDNLSIDIYTPYEQLNITNYNLSTCNLFKGERSMHILLFPILLIIFSPFLLIYFIYKRAGR
ncbi:MAG: hypothetical protein BA871_03575 [Desulfuromonadales bacterium C00003096]|nr:MAG: hypothetical protein BA871_03575 [Desulfuromonadales bacterium C00003096]